MLISFKRKEAISLILYATLSSILGLTLLYYINTSVIINMDISYENLFSFIVILVYTFIFHKIFQEKIITISNNFILEKEMHIIEVIGNSNLKDLEKINEGRLYGIVEDIRGLVFIPYLVSNGLTSAILFLGGVIYLFHLSASSSLVFILFIAVFVGLYQLLNRINLKLTEESRINNEKYFQYLRDLIGGFKEILLSQKKKKKLVDQKLFENREHGKNLEIRVSNVFLIGNLLGSYGLWLLLGLISFLFPILGLMSSEKIVPYIIALLFISGSITALISLQNYAVKQYVSLKRIKSFTEELSALSSDPSQLTQTHLTTDFKNIQLKDLSFKYPTSEFGIKPINLTINKGETIFIIGGNGSGKSTFLKVFMNLYRASKGKIVLDGKPVLFEDNQYRELFSAIFTNNHLFSEHYEDYDVKTNKEYNVLLKKVKLDSIIEENEDVSNRSFSKGQSKRLSMIYALLEQRSILVLDEWAADQDPHFRKYFYEELIPELKSQGKTIIAVTHDDVYFKYADRVIKFEYGKIVKDVYTKDKPTLVDLNIW
ncbi:ATP-binding cassette domain-containing protein [Croceitalea marina]|uniref:ATP-binding cassette domain-containing protein n=1 Tax=Croceitalea marina TaxID=1775166 RepID=A0ABW5N043_9FLAO